MRKSFRHIFHPQCESKLRENLNGFVDARKISIEMPLWKSRELISIRTDDNSRMRSFRKPNESSRGDEEEKSWIHYSAWCKKAFVMRLKTELRKKKGKVLLSSSLDQSQQSAERRNEVQSTEKLWIDKKKNTKSRTHKSFIFWLKANTISVGPIHRSVVSFACSIDNRFRRHNQLPRASFLPAAQRRVKQLVSDEFRFLNAVIMSAHVKLRSCETKSKVANQRVFIQ